MYVLIGSGRMATHLAHWLSLYKIPLRQWTRKLGAPLEESVEPGDIILSAISDDGIADLYRSHETLHGNTWVHFSGAVHVPGMFGCHPLMSFGPELYTKEFYDSIPFVCEEGSSFDTLFPGLPNRHLTIHSSRKALYHAACVIGGNLPVILWQHAARLLEKAGLNEEAPGTAGMSPEDLLGPYRRRIGLNMDIDMNAALTGPFKRGDSRTIAGHLEALEGDPIEPVYRAFAAAAGNISLKEADTGDENISIEKHTTTNCEETFHDYIHS
jgi:predicted short-subunit dehydrogenase-like oxidoreductase (DUF2520 family)